MPESDAPSRDRIRTLFRNVSATEGRGYAPLYEALGPRIADDEWMLDLLDAAPPPNRRPVQLFAAVHDRVLADPSVPLAQWYGSVAGEKRRTDDAWPALRAFCEANEQALRDIVRSRTVQTNEIGRSAVLYPLFQALCTRKRKPLRLVDVGASAGLNLFADRYAYRYSPGGRRGAPRARAVLEAQVRGERATPPDGGVPRIAARIGIDREPIDVRDEQATRWLRACVFPDNVERAHRLAAALEVAREAPPRMLRGDPADLLETLVREAPADEHPVFFHTWVTIYMTDDERRAFRATLDALGARRDFTWIAGEMLSAIPGIAAPAPADEAPRLDRPTESPTVFVQTDWSAAAADARFVARSHPHGAWIEWLDLPASLGSAKSRRFPVRYREEMP